MEIDLVNDLVGTPMTSEEVVVPPIEEQTQEPVVETQTVEEPTGIPEEPKQEYNDPFIRAYLKAKEKESFDTDEFIQNYNKRNQIDKMNSVNGLKEYYSSIKEGDQRKYNDETIEKYISNLSDIEKDKEWNSVKENMLKEHDEFFDRKDQDYKQYLSKYYEDVQKDTEDLLNTIIISKEKVGDIAGIPHTKEVSGKFQEKFKDLMSVDKESEPLTIIPRKIHKLLNDNELLYNLMYIYERLQDGGLKDYIETMRNEKVDNTLNKMGINPSNRGASTGKPITPPTSSDFV